MRSSRPCLAPCALLCALMALGHSASAQNAASNPTVAFAAATFNALPSVGAVTITVNRSGDTSGPVIVTYTTLDGTAIAGTDYSATIGTLSWAGGDSTPKSFSVPITTTDAVYNSFVVALTSASGANFAEPLEATVTISDSSSSSSGASTSVPAPAASVGYNTNTFNSTTIAANGGPWLLDNFYGQSTNAGQVVQEANGSMSFPGTTGTQGGVSTAHIDSTKDSRHNNIVNIIAAFALVRGHSSNHREKHRARYSVQRAPRC